MFDKSCCFFKNICNKTLAVNCEVKSDPSLLGFDLLVEIFKKLSKNDLANVSEVSRVWFKVSSSNTVWKALLLNEPNIDCSEKYLEKIIHSGGSIRLEFVKRGLQTKISRFSSELNKKPLSGEKPILAAPSQDLYGNFTENPLIYCQLDLESVSVSLITCFSDFIDGLANFRKRQVLNQLVESLEKYSSQKNML